METRTPANGLPCVSCSVITHFAAGVISQKNRVPGQLKGQGNPNCLIDYVQNEEKVDVGEWFFTTGTERIFPKGLPAGQVTAVRNGKDFKEIDMTD